MLNFFISSALAQDVATSVAKQPAAWTSMLPLIAIMGIFYLFIIRPQQKKIKEHQSLLKSISKGDRVVTTSGIFAVVSKVNEDDATVMLEIADNVSIKSRLESITEILDKKELNLKKAVEEISKNATTKKTVAKSKKEKSK